MRPRWTWAILGLLLAVSVAHAQLISGSGAGGGSGTVTSIGTAGCVTGGTITTTGTITDSTCVSTSVSITSNQPILGGSGRGVISLNTGSGFLRSGSPPVWASVSLASEVTASLSVNNMAASGTPSATTFLRGDGSWATPGGGGTVTASGATGAGRLAAFTASTNITNTNLSGDVVTSDTAATVIQPGVVTGPKASAPLAYRTCTMVVGADNGSALVDADIAPQGQQCFVPAAGTIQEVTVAADNGTPAVMVRTHTASGTNTNLLATNLPTKAAGAVNCMNAGGTTGLDGVTTCAASLSVSSLAPGVWLETSAGVAGGAAKRMTISITWRPNN